MKYAAQDQWVNVVLLFLHPLEQFFHQLRNQPRRRGHKNTLLAIKNAFLATPETARFFHHIFCHDTVIFFQVTYTVRIDLRKFLICIVGIFYFLNFFSFPQYSPSVDHIPDLS